MASLACRCDRGKPVRTTISDKTRLRSITSSSSCARRMRLVSDFTTWHLRHMAKQNGLRDDLHALIARMNKANDGTMVVPGEYLEVVVTKQ